MTHNYKTIPFLSLVLLCLTNIAHGQTLMHYWNFNDNTSIAAITTPSKSIISGVSLVAIAGGTSVVDAAGGTAQNFDLLNINARNSDVAGTHLRFNNPIGGALQFAIPTTGYQNVVVKMATRRSSSGAGNQLWSYSTDGTNFVAFSTIAPNNGDPALATLDFAAITAANNNPNFKLKVEFAQGSGGLVGNNRFDNFTVDGSSLGGGDSTAPVATLTPANASTGISTTANMTISFDEAVRLLNDTALNDTNVDALVELRLNSATGTSIPFDATLSGNVISINPTATLANSQNYYLALLPNSVEDASNNAVTTVKSVIFTTGSPVVSLASNFVTVNENVGTLSFTINLLSPVTGSVDLVVKGAPFSTANSSDFTLATQTLNFTDSSPASVVISIPVIDDSASEQQAEYFVLSLENPVNFAITGTGSATVFIKDNDRVAKTATNQIELNYIGSFDPSGANTSTCEIVVHDPASQRLFTTSAISGYLDIVNFSNPAAPTLLSSINMNPYGGITSVAVKNGIVAVASPNADETLNGSVVLFDINGTFLKQVVVGALPDMIVFSPDGTKILTANEGQPNVAYSTDPEGSVSVIDISGGIPNLTQTNVATLLLTQYNSQETALMASGIRKVKSTSTLSQDFEPEYVSISPDSQKAWISLQENNAVVELNLTNNTYTAIWALGTKDISAPGNGFDISDSNTEVLIANWPVKSYYNPDAIANFSVAGTNYLITANEGDERDYSGFTERTTVGASTYTLDATAFPNAGVLKQTYNMGRFRVTNQNGNTDADTAFEEMYCLGARSFSIFNASTKAIIYDSGDDFEMITASLMPTLFNADHSDNLKKGRSRAKGPEPEGVTTAIIAGQTFAFISLERIGGVMVYNITNPNAPTFVDYKNSRSTSAYAGDNGAEGITYIAPANSATGKGYVLVANEISGTITIFEVNEKTLSTEKFDVEKATFVLFPNPSEKGVVYFNRTANVQVYDITGKLLLSQEKAQLINTTNLTAGTYFVKTDEGIVKQMIVK